MHTAAHRIASGIPVSKQIIAMNQSTKKPVFVEPPKIRVDWRVRWERENGITLADLGHAAATTQRLALPRKGGKPGQFVADKSGPPECGSNENGTKDSAANDEPQKPCSELKREAREAMERILNLLLADEYQLYKITRDYHWNISGPDYFSLRLLFQLQHEAAAGWVDAVTEKIRTMHFAARISWESLKELSRVSVVPGFELPARYMLAELLAAHDQIIVQLQADRVVCLQRHGEEPMAGFLTGLMEQHENSAWMLRAQLETADIKTSEPSVNFI